MPEASLSPSHRSTVTVHPKAERLRFGPFLFDKASRSLKRGDEEIGLPARSVGILEGLLASPGEVVSKQNLLDRVWQGTHVSETSLTEAVSQLRQALGDDPQKPTYVQTVHRRGYRFIASVDVEGPPSSTSPSSASPSSTSPSSASPSSTSQASASKPSASRIKPNLRLASVILVAALLGLAAGWWLSHRRPALDTAEEPVGRFTIVLDARDAVTPKTSPALALSRDGRQLFYLTEREGERQLYRRPVGRFEATPIPGTDSAAGPFLSPDGRWVGFFSRRKLKKIPVAGGEAITLCEALYTYGASWGDHGEILFSPMFGKGLLRVSELGGEPVELTVVERKKGERGHWWPEILPGGEWVLFTVWTGDALTSRIDALSLVTGERRTVLDGASFARYSAATGHLVLGRSSGLAAAPFDLETMTLGGPVTAVLDGVMHDPQTGASQFTLDRAGNLIYVPVRTDADPGQPRTELQVVLGWARELEGLLAAAPRRRGAAE